MIQSEINLLIQELAAADQLEDIQNKVKVAARRIAASEGSTFVLLDGECCYYADEDSMSPLWKGQRFPATQCVSGWAMMHRTTVVIPDIRNDERVPQDAYRPTFVRSLVMAPMLAPEPLGAIGVYWSRPRRPTPEVADVMESLAGIAAKELLRFPDGLPDPSFKPAWATVR
ncbi:MAG: GAF domain-containing protein [Mycobacterium sp.]|nr:GAF domain-containing protein [Mycobacterium sp.]